MEHKEENGVKRCGCREARAHIMGSLGYHAKEHGFLHTVRWWLNESYIDEWPPRSAKQLDKETRGPWQPLSIPKANKIMGDTLAGILYKKISFTKENVTR